MQNVFIEIIPPRGNLVGPKTFKELIEKFEIYANSDNKIPAINLHIWKKGDVLRFIVECHETSQEFVINQVYSYFPDSDVSVLKDEKIFMGSRFIAETSLKLSNNDIYPLKSVLEFEEGTDSIAPILSTLYKNEDEEVLYSISLTPLGDNWHSFAKSVATLFINKKSGKDFSLMQKIKLKKLYKTENIIDNVIYYTFSVGSYLSKYLIKPKPEAPTDPTTLETKPTDNDKREDNLDREVKGTEKANFLSKILGQGFKTTISINIGTSQNKGEIYYKSRFKEIAQSFSGFSRPYINSLVLNGKIKVSGKYEPKYNTYPSLYLTDAELAALYHLPTDLIKNQPGLRWRNNVTVPPPENLPLVGQGGDTEIGITRYRDTKKTFGILPEDRRRHMYIIGKTGMGKSKLLENMLFDDINAGRGVAIIDPHGDTAETVLSFIPKHRINDVILFDPSDTEYPIGFNLLENISPEMNTVVASGIVSIFKKMNANSWGPRLEYILYNTLLTLLQIPNTSLLGVARIFVDAEYRKYIVEQIDDPVLKSFWNDEIGKMQEKMLVEAVSPIQNKIGPFLSSPMVRNIMGQAKSTLNLRYIMDNKKIFICNLSKGKLGDLNSGMLGAMMITKFQIDAMSRANMPMEQRNDFYLYVDEFQNFATDSFAVILSEARKYRLNLVVANQFIAQMPEEVKNAVFGNIGTIINFQLGYDDAVYIANQYENRVSPNDLMGLGVRQAYSRLLINNLPSKVFSIWTSLARSPLYQGNELEEHVKKIKTSSRERFGTPKMEVIEKIRKWNEPKISQATIEKTEREKAKKEQKKNEIKPNNNQNPSSNKPHHFHKYKKR